MLRLQKIFLIQALLVSKDIVLEQQAFSVAAQLAIQMNFAQMLLREPMEKALFLLAWRV
jgi:hypothetical protein